MTAHGVELRGVAHRYGDGPPAISDVSLSIAPGELLALLGPSGCGKTTLLRAVAGFLRPDAGDVIIGGARVNDVPASQRDVGIVFQNYALFPHMSVADNVAYGLRARGASRGHVRDRVTRMLALVQMGAFADRAPRALSGGQQQRVALARALAIEPQVVLLDEPFSALDRGLRLDMQIEVRTLLARQNVTAILVTHDQEEALSMADRVAVMHRGRIAQVDAPAAIYDRPATLFVNQFVGRANLLEGVVRRADAGGLMVALRCGAALRPPAVCGFAVGDAVIVSARPENLRLAPADAPGALPATVRLTAPLGADEVIEATLEDGQTVKLVRQRAADAPAAAPGARVGLTVADPDALSLFRADPTLTEETTR